MMIHRMNPQTAAARASGALARGRAPSATTSPAPLASMSVGSVSRPTAASFARRYATTPVVIVHPFEQLTRSRPATPPPSPRRLLSARSEGIGGTSGPSDNGETKKDRTKRRLDVAIVGAPNAGKSQLLNALTRSPVAAVSRKRHTTRTGVLGARTLEDTQLVFVDTPGFLRLESAKREGLLGDLISSAKDEIDAADYTLVVVDAARKIDDDLKEAICTLMLRAVHARGRDEGDDDADADERKDEDDDDDEEEEWVEVKEKFAIVLNKVDLVNPKTKLLDLASELGAMGDECVKYRGQDQEEVPPLTDEQTRILEAQFPMVFYVSALHDDGVEDIVKHLLSRATPCNDWVVPPNAVTEMSPVERVEEVIREKIYRCLHREVPHHVQQVNRAFRTVKRRDTGEKAIRIDQELVVRTESHRRLVAGRGGMILRRIEETAQRDLAKIFGCAVSLNLHIKLTKSRHRRPLESAGFGIMQRKV